jgi:hypothetical protein
MTSSQSGWRIGVSIPTRKIISFVFGGLTQIFPDDGLSYCTWNGIGQHLTEQKLFDALESLAKNEINISNLIIDDNWQSLVSIVQLLKVNEHLRTKEP